MSEKKKDIPQLWTAISHEIRTPLNVIKGMANISENEIYDVELMRDCLNKINESAKRMQEVVNSIVDYAAITQRNLDIQNNKIDFKTMITEIAMHSYMISKQKRCHFNIHVQDVTEEALLSDEARISQVLMTMLNIVVRYTRSEGVIDFTVRQTGISNSKVFIRFCMRSTALEFPDEIVDYLNDNSLYMNPDLLTPRGTFGITEVNALYIAYLMGGKISAKNKPGDYSEIIFDMEFDRTEQPYSVSGATLFAKQRILIVADSKDICEERGRMLDDMGMTYSVATEVEEALDTIGEAEDEKPFTICIIDRDMKENACITLIEQIREIFGQELVIIVTAHDPLEQVKEVRHYGANYVIDRTIFRSTLFDALIGVEKGIQIEQETEKEEEYDFSGNRVLVAEDVALNMEVITKLLSRVNIEVLCVENGLEAVLQYNKKPEGYFDAVLLDINMPVMDGYTAAKKIRASEKKDASTIPIYAMTANAFKEDVEKALDSGMDGHIAKPIDVNALYRILNNVLNKQHEEDEFEKLKELADLDPLTGCLNRRGFDNSITELMAKKEPVAYVAIDIDDFKQVNDRFGHEIGDEILKKVVTILKKKFRVTDYFVRFGGDEFAVVLIDYARKSIFLRRRMDEVNEELLHPNDELPPVTISAGAAISQSGYRQDLYSNADKALYQAKNSGKGTCVVWDDMESEIEGLVDENAISSDRILYLNDRIKVIVEKKQQLQSALMVKNKPVGFATGFLDAQMTIYSYNGFLPDLLGYRKNEFVLAAKGGFNAFVHPDDKKNLYAQEYSEIIQNKKLRLVGKEGDIQWFNVDYMITKTTEGQDFWMASFKNIDDSLVGALCEEDYCLVAIIDVDQNLVTIDKGAYLASDKELHNQKMYNYKLLIENAISKTIKESERDTYVEKASLENICQKLSFGGMYEFSVYQKWGEAEQCIVRHKYRYLTGKKNEILCTWEPLGYRAEIDELTDIFNEQGFYRRVEEIMRSADSSKAYDILYLDISDFKAWNSMLGRENGDKILKITARSILKSEMKPIAVTRIVSDHFACIVERENCNENAIGELCNNQFKIEGNNIVLQMKCGVFHVEDKRESIRSMCDKARLAITQIKNERAIPYHVFDNTLNETYIQHNQVINQLGNALEREEIKVYYQPIVDAKTKKIISAEALIRWSLPGGRILSPAVFIPALEEKGYIADVDAYVQNVVCSMIKRRIDSNKKVVPVSVNVSRMDFLNEEFIGNTKDIINTMEKEKHYMNIEITESSFTEIGKNGEALLKELRERGIHILMDDFGTGFSTLSGITSNQFDVIKIDMSFVRGIGRENGAEAVLSNVISMCHALNMSVVAEGVETEEQYKFLCDADCDYIQGYYFYKPMPEEEFEQMLEDVISEEKR